MITRDFTCHGAGPCHDKSRSTNEVWLTMNDQPYDFNALTPAGPQKVNWWHEQIVDWELQHPDGKMRDCALHFGKTESWLSTVRNCDAYRDYRARRVALHQSMVSESVIDKVEGLAKLTLDVLQERIEDTKDEVPLGFVRETAETALKALGYGARGGGNGQTQVVQVQVISAESLERARGLMRSQHENVSVEHVDTEAEHDLLPAPAQL